MNIETADRLIALRKRKGLSQEELAEVLGVSRQAVSKWERAESGPDMDNAIQLSRLYNISLDELFGNKPEYEIELDSMEPDLQEPAASEAVTAPEIVPAQETSLIKDEAPDTAMTVREAAAPSSAEPIPDLSSYEGIRRLVCSVRADLAVTGTDSGVCTVRCEGPEKEKSRCFVYTEGDTLHIESEDAKKKLFFGLQGKIRLSISVELPKALSVEVSLKGGDLDMDGVRTDKAACKTGGGDIEVKGGAYGELDLKTGGGDIEVDSAKAQRAELTTGGGEIITKGFNTEELFCARTGGGDIKAEGSAKCFETTTGGGDITLDVKTERIEAKTGGGDIKIRCADVKYVGARTGGGDVKATLVGCTGVVADLGSAGGEASIDYKNDKQSSGRKLKFAAGDGSAALEMRSGGGDVSVKVE